MTNSLVDHLCSRNRRAPEWREAKTGTCADGSWYLERQEISANGTRGCASMTALQFHRCNPELSSGDGALLEH